VNPPAESHPDSAAARFQPDDVTGVVFDIGGVFLYPNYAPVRQWMSEQVPQLRTELDDFRRAHHAGVRALSLAKLDPDESNPDFWAFYDRAYTDQLGIDGDLIDEVRPYLRNRWDWTHQPNIAAFHRLAQSDYRLAIVSNNDGSAQAQMVEFKVCQVGPGPLPEVAIVVDSTVEGVAKPDPAIFGPAIDAVGLPPEELLYVGDTVHADVMGATAAGMQVVQLDPFDQHADFPHPRVTDLDALLERLPRIWTKL
jgi:putative hydrolase of the HAD superfamily